MRTTLFLIIYLINFSVELSQNTADVDSLKRVLPSATNGKETALIQLKLAKAYQKLNRDTSRFYSNKAAPIDRKIKTEK